MAEKPVEQTEPQVSEEQQEIIDDVLDTPDDDLEAPAEEPGEQEPKGTPKPEPAAEDTKKKDGTEEPKKDETPVKDEPAAEVKDKDKKQAEDPEFEIDGKDGVKMVKLSALKQTYRQLPVLQAKHEEVKPFFDLSKSSGIPVGKMFQFAVIGIQAVHEASQRKQTPAGYQPAPKPEGYQGPFESAQQEAELKESDPILYRTTRALWDQNQALQEHVLNLTGRLEQQPPARAVPPEGQPTDPAQPSPERQRVDGLIGGVQKAHESYFKTHPDRVETFKQFLAGKFHSVPLSSVDESFLTFAFQQFDPAYFAAWQEEQMKGRLEKTRLTNRRTFGERDSVRGSVGSSMTEQQEAMADLFSE